jgi:hypothetical protein
LGTDVVLGADVACYLNFQNYFSMEKDDVICGDFIEFLELFLMEKGDMGAS